MSVPEVLAEIVRRVEAAIVAGAERDGIALPDGWARERAKNAATQLVDLVDPSIDAEAA